MEQCGDKVRQAWLRGFGDVRRRNSGYTGQRMMKMEEVKMKTSEKIRGCRD